MYIPDHSSPLEEKFINYLMRRGKKTIARKIFQNTLAEIQKQGNKEPEKLFEKAIENAKPNLEVRPKRIGGSVYQIPLEVKPKRQIMLSFKWIINASKEQKGPMHKKLAKEIIETANGTGAAIKKKEDTHRMAQANRAFAHYARY